MTLYTLLIKKIVRVRNDIPMVDVVHKNSDIPMLSVIFGCAAVLLVCQQCATYFLTSYFFFRYTYGWVDIFCVEVYLVLFVNESNERIRFTST